MSWAFPQGPSRTGINRILSCAVAIILPMMETLGQGRWRCSHHGFGRTKIYSFPRSESSVLSRRISFRISGCHCFVRRTSGALPRGISASGPPVLSNRHHQYRVRVDTPKASAAALIPCFSRKCSAFILNSAISGITESFIA